MSDRVKRARKCPICDAPTEERWRPFCSRRCADIDLSRWLSGAYAIPGGGADADEDGDEIATIPPSDEDSTG
jgi:endogenous inhibitor of DNA gyrase (YacG/DUF329 family)